MLIFALAVIAVFVVASVYFYFRAEGLQRDLLVAKREISNMVKENNAMISSMAAISATFEDIAKQRFNHIKRVYESLPKSEESVQQLLIIQPLIFNYSLIYRDCSKGNNRFKAITEQCFNSYDDKGYKAFITYVNSQEDKIRKMWASNNLNGFISLAETLLRQHEEKILKGASRAQVKKAS